MFHRTINQTCFIIKASVLFLLINSNPSWATSIHQSINKHLVTPLQITIQVLQPSCAGQFGLLTILAQGGTPPYSYLTNGNITTPSSNLYAGTYTITVADSSSNSIQSIVSILNPTALNFQYCILPPACLACLTPLSVNPAGGTPPYNVYVNAQLGVSPFLLSSGSYTILVEDANACTTATNIKINKPSNGNTVIKKVITPLSYYHPNTINTINDAFNVFPNPCQSYLNIKQASSNKNINQISILNAFGNVMYYNNINPSSNQTQWQVSTDAWPRGIYYLRVSQAEHPPICQPFIKE